LESIILKPFILDFLKIDPQKYKKNSNFAPNFEQNKMLFKIIIFEKQKMFQLTRIEISNL
jgi:hypothetical protein